MILNIIKNTLIPQRGKRKQVLTALSALFVFLLLLLPMSCSSEAPPMGNSVRGRDSLPVMVTRGVSKLISDSGVMRYKIITEEWRVFDRTQPPRWEFPKGLFLERYDDKFKVNMRFTADSAWLYDQKTWKLRGHVLLDDQEAHSLLRTEELYWNMQTGEMSSNVHTFLRQPNQSIEGDWFRAIVRNGRPTRYHVRQSKGFMPMGGLGDSPTTQQPSQGGGEQNDSTPQPSRQPAQSRPKSKIVSNNQ